MLVVDDGTFETNNSSELKLGVVSSWKIYEDEPTQLFHSKVLIVLYVAFVFVSLSGEDNKTLLAVVKFRTTEYADVSFALSSIALTLQ